MNIKTKIAYIKERVSIEQVLNLYSIKKGSTQGAYHCPFHGEDKHASVSVRKGFFHCFTCGEKLDIIGFVQKMNKCTILEALKFLDKYFELGAFNLHWKEEKEIRDLLRAREYEIKKAKYRELWYSQKLTETAQELNFWEIVQKDYEPKFTEVLNGTWDGHWFFYSLKRQQELNAIYDGLLKKSYYEKKLAEKKQIETFSKNKDIEKGDIKK